MQVKNISQIYNNVYIPIRTKPMGFDSVSFSGTSDDSQYLKAKKYARYKKFVNYFKLFPDTLNNYNLEKLEGIQKGIKIFDGLNMKDIAFMLDNLDAIAVKRGCSNQCLHCYANAKPDVKEQENFINRMPFEDFEEITNGLKELGKRLRISPLKSRICTVLFYDTDCMEIVLYDKNGKEHDFRELTDMLYDATKQPALFDTAGWNHKNPKMQARAEKYVKYLNALDNSKKFHQINLSISPFNKIYAKALELGFNPQNYSVSEEKINSNTGDEKIQKGKFLYDTYISRIANMLYTFTPLIDNTIFSIIERPIKNSEQKMKNFTENDLKIIQKHILQKLTRMYQADLNGEQKYINVQPQIAYNIDKYKNIMENHIDTDLSITGRLLELYKKRNIYTSYEDLEKDFPNIKENRINYEIIKNSKNIYGNKDKFINIIDANGKLYLYDGYRFIPTELALNIGAKNKTTPALSPEPEKDFTITREMINKSRP